MPRQPDGSFVRSNGNFSGATVWQQQANSQDKTISSTRHDTHDEDLGQALGNSLDRTGVGTMLANLDLGGFGVTNGTINAANVTVPNGTTRTVQSKLGEWIHVFDRIPPAQHAAILAGTSTYDADSDLAQAFVDAAAQNLPLMFPGPGSKIRSAGTAGVQLAASGVDGLYIDFNGCTIERSAASGTFLYTQDQIETNRVTLTANAAVGTGTPASPVALPTGQGANFSVGQLIIFESNKASIAADIRAREMHKIVGITGDSIVLESPLRYDYNTVDSARVQNVSAIGMRNITLKNLLVTTSANTNTGRILRLNQCENVFLSNCRGIQPGGGFQFVDCWNLYAENLLVDRPNKQGGTTQDATQYGVNVVGSTQHWTFNNLVGHDCRHVFTTLDRVLADSFSYGEPYLGYVSGTGTLSDDSIQSSIFDTHKSGRAITFQVKAIQAPSNSGGASGISMRARQCVLLDCYTRGGKDGLDITAESRECQVLGGIFEDVSDRGIMISAPCIVRDASIFRSARQGIQVSADNVFLLNTYIEEFGINGILNSSPGSTLTIEGGVINKGAGAGTVAVSNLRATDSCQNLNMVGFASPPSFFTSNAGGVKARGLKINGVAFEDSRVDVTQAESPLNANSAYGGLTYTNDGATGNVEIRARACLTGHRFRLYRAVAPASLFTFKPNGTDYIFNTDIGSGGPGQAVDLGGMGTTIEFFCITDGEWIMNIITGSASYV